MEEEAGSKPPPPSLFFSDGLESVALEQAMQQPFARVFYPMIKTVDQARADGALAEL